MRVRGWGGGYGTDKQQQQQRQQHDQAAQRSLARRRTAPSLPGAAPGSRGWHGRRAGAWHAAGAPKQRARCTSVAGRRVSLATQRGAVRGCGQCEAVSALWAVSGVVGWTPGVAAERLWFDLVSVPVSNGAQAFPPHFCWRDGVGGCSPCLFRLRMFSQCIAVGQRPFSILVVVSIATR